MQVITTSKVQKKQASCSRAVRFYELTPQEEVALEEFEQYAVDRLQVLRAIDNAKARGKKADEMQDLVGKLWSKHMGIGAEKPEIVVRKDTISHFALRLAYCRTEDLRRWFLTQEVFLFRCLFKNMSPSDQDTFIKDCNLSYEKATSSDHNDEHIRAALTLTQSSEGAFYKVPFEEVPDLVATRKVYLHRGFAFVGKEQLISLLCGVFRAKLSKSLASAWRFLSSKVASEESDRIAPMLESLSKRYLGPDYTKPTNSGQVSLSDLDNLAHTSFPLCMRHLYLKLKEDHHLKHNGRLQFGLFLKGIGLTLEDAMAFWRSEFTKKMSVEKFEKEYAYNIRYNYGKEGKRVDYTPYSCVKIIGQTPGIGDHHGCPYRHFSDESLRSALGELRLAPQSVGEIMDKVKGQHYQVACSLAFEGCHGTSCETGINHPNQYFEESQKIYKERANEQPTTPLKLEQRNGI